MAHFRHQLLVFAMNPSRPYHHGNLRAELIEAAIAVTQQHGHESVSLRGLAETLGVSRGAPYRHFPDRESLLSEVALHGFETLERHLQDIDTKPLSGRRKLEAAAREFLHFVRTNPKIFRAMYEANLLADADSHPQLAACLHRTYDGLDGLLAQALPDVSVQARKLRLIAMWSTLYGFAKIGQTDTLQTYMKEGLSDAQIDMAVLQTAIGPLPDLD